MNGIIKFYKKEKGWGFITKEDGSDIFFHRKGFPEPRPKEEYLVQDTLVSFEVQNTDKGESATEIRLT